MIATSAAMRPDAAPRVVACPSRSFSTISQPQMPAHDAAMVLSTTTEALLSAASAEPPLNPNQPKNRMPAPRTVSGRLCGRGGFRNERRLPRTMMTARAAMPALMWTAVPPAKSTAPRVLAIQPPTTDPSSESNAKTQCATGKYTSTAHSPANTIQAENFMRSARAPHTRATVMPANKSWNPAISAGGSPGSAGASSSWPSPRYSRGLPSSPAPPSEFPSTAE
ncbi:hypothetical protein GQ85_12485 [Rhodococcus rhodochrous]|nr:hypothetical protein GQ85_12485 [Rhodococcus rhodochrous]